MVHLDVLSELNSDPEVMRYLLGRAATRAEVETEWAVRLGPRTDEARGLGYWVGFVDDAFVGWWSASAFAPDPAVSNIGHRLRRNAWGRGLATEGGRAMVTQAFSARGIERVFASTMAVNTASRAVLDKVGLRHTDTHVSEWEDPIDGWEHGEVVYEISRRDWVER